LDAARVAADEEGNHVFGEVGGDRELTTVEGGVAEAVEAVLRHQLQGDEVAAGTGHDHPSFYDFHAPPSFRDRRSYRLTPHFSRTSGQPPLGLGNGETRRRASREPYTLEPRRAGQVVRS